MKGLRLSEGGLQEMLKRGGARVAQPRMVRAEEMAPVAKPVRGKFFAVKTMVGNEQCDSRKEAAQLLLYRDQETMGQIRNLVHQGRVSLDLNGVHIGFFEPDFMFEKPVDGVWRLHATDTKGYRRGSTYELFKVKARVFLAIHGTAVVEL